MFSASTTGSTHSAFNSMETIDQVTPTKGYKDTSSHYTGRRMYNTEFFDEYSMDDSPLRYERGRDRERQTETETDRQRERERDRQTERDRDREAERERQRETETDRDRQINDIVIRFDSDYPKTYDPTNYGRASYLSSGGGNVRKQTSEPPRYKPIYISH